MAEKEIAVWDYNVDGLVSGNNIVISNNEDAVVNAFVNWAQTDLGEVINDPNAGGSLFQHQFKHMSDWQQMKILFTIKAQVDNFFRPALQILRLDINNDNINQEWTIDIEYYIPEFNQVKTTAIPLKRLNIKSGFTEEIEEVTYVGTALENFVKIYLWEMVGITLKWNGTYWQWGTRFIFLNLQSTDDNFDYIKALINNNQY
jgi:hypothetical protein